MGASGRPKSLNGFAVGDVVAVRSVEEILGGLDERGERDSLPFMPEMLKFCGEEFVVDSISYKTCDTVNITGLHRMEDTVHLTGLRCDGQSHGGCEAGCLIYWKTDWLRPVSTGPTRPPMADQGSRPGCTPERLDEVAHGAYGRREGAEDGVEETVYSCQATELPRATGDVIPLWNLRQYVDDVRYRNAPAGRVLTGILIEVFNKAQALSRRILPPWLRVKRGVKYPFIVGTAQEDAGRTIARPRAGGLGEGQVG